MCGYEIWTIKKAECWRIDAFELWYWIRLLRVPWTARRSTKSRTRLSNWTCMGENKLITQRLLLSNVTMQSVQFSHSVVSDSLRPHESQHSRPPCPSATPGVHSDSRPSSQWCHPAISSSVVPFSSCPQSFPTSGSFQMSQLFPSGGQSIGVSASASVLPMNTQDWSPLGWTGWTSLKSKVLSRVFSNLMKLQCSRFLQNAVSFPSSAEHPFLCFSLDILTCSSL